MSESFYDYKAKDIKGEEVAMSTFKDKVVLVVNTASACYFTPQYKGLQRLYDKYQNQGLEILAFPCNQFAEEEKGSNEEIAEFCELNYKVSFPLFSKINVNGERAEPLFKFLKDAAKGFMGTTSVKWNFSKFLISKKGKVVKRFGSLDAPESFENDIQSELQ